MNERERISAEIHKCYCWSYMNKHDKPYWTNGDYSKLDEPTKEFDRVMADWHISEIRRIIEPLIIELRPHKLRTKNGYRKAIKQTLKNAGII